MGACHCLHEKSGLVVFVRAARLFILFALFVSAAYASELAVKVTVTQDTLAVGTNVSLVTGGVALAMQKAGLDGIALFNVTDGSYFVVIPPSSIYPKYVSLVRVNGNTNITLTKWMPSPGSPANAYGQIFGPTDFSNASVVAHSSGRVAKKVAPNKDGFFALSIQEGNYELSFSVPGFEQQKKQVFLPSADYVEVNPTLVKTGLAPEPVLSLVAPGKAELKSVIEVALTRGASPLAGEQINVETPSGKVSISTGSDGKARVNAAEAGAYKFLYANLSAVTAVVGASKPQPPEPQIVPPAVQPAQPPAQQPKQDGGNAGAILFVVLAFLAVIGLAAIFLAGLRYLGHKKKRHRG